LDVLARTIYGEARGELFKFGLSSLIAIGNVVANRKNKNFAPTIGDVCTAPYQFSCWNEKDPNYEKMKNVTKESSIFKICLEVAENILTEKWPDLTDGCDHYHERTVKPSWASRIAPKRIFGSHYFYELRKMK
ncbi:MAG: cell wall hydrolase, partial [Holosporaceae bacterium]|nr:cell wall hydrolase [Holosporaceae bacterium]